MASGRDWEAERDAHAREMLRDFMDEVAFEARWGDVKEWINDGVDVHDYTHEACGNGGGFSLLEAAEVLDAFPECEETDDGLWESLGPRDAVAAQAFYTYRNAVFSEWRSHIDGVNYATSAEDDESRREGLARLYILLETAAIDRGTEGAELAKEAMLDVGCSEAGCVGILCDWLDGTGHPDAGLFREAYDMATKAPEGEGDEEAEEPAPAQLRAEAQPDDRRHLPGGEPAGVDGPPPGVRGGAGLPDGQPD
jgi:hypothetical protein